MSTLLRSADIRMDPRQADSDSGSLGAAVARHEDINQMSAQLRRAGGITRPFGLCIRRFGSPKCFAWISYSEIQSANAH